MAGLQGYLRDRAKCCLWNLSSEFPDFEILCSVMFVGCVWVGFCFVVVVL